MFTKKLYFSPHGFLKTQQDKMLISASHDRFHELLLCIWEVLTRLHNLLNTQILILLLPPKILDLFLVVIPLLCTNMQKNNCQLC